MSQTTLNTNISAAAVALYMALELSLKKWVIRFRNAQGKQTGQTVEGGDRQGLLEAIRKAKVRLGLPEDAEVRSCYEAGRDGFWLHRWLTAMGVENVVIDPASVEVSRQARRAKTDRLDVEMLLERLWRHWQGERVWSVVRVPTQEAEDGRQLHRELEVLKGERTRHGNRLKSVLISQGIRLEKVGGPDWEARVDKLKDWDGNPLLEDLKQRLIREGERLKKVEEQIKQLETERDRRIAEAEGAAPEMARKLKMLKGVGAVAAWVFVMEFYGWRTFSNRKQVGALAGLVGTPYASGQMQREQGISKQGNARVRALAIEIAWLWLRYQPDSALSRWFRERFGSSGSRHKRVGIVALARKLLVALWHYLEHGVIPDGAKLKTA